MAKSLEKMIVRTSASKSSTSVLRINPLVPLNQQADPGKIEKEQGDPFNLAITASEIKELDEEAEYALGSKYSKVLIVKQEKKQVAEFYQNAATQEYEKEYEDGSGGPTSERGALNYKNPLLEIAQSYFGVERPQFIHFDYGPHHAKVFRCICSFHTQMTSSLGRTKIEAEKLASQAMLSKIEYVCFKKVDNEAIALKTQESTILSTQILELLKDLKHDANFEVLSLYGNAVLRYVIAQYLYDNYAEFREDVLTLIISEAMREETRAKVAANLKLEAYVRTEVTIRTLADTLSAVIGKLNSLNLDSITKKLILEHYQPFIDHSAWIILSNVIRKGQVATTVQIKTTIHNHKNELQEYAQKRRYPLPSYHLISKEGDDHAPTFTVKCIFKSMTNIGSGSTVKSAEQNAARATLEDISLDVDKERLVSRSQTYAISPQSDFTNDARDLTELRIHLDLPDYVTVKHLAPAFIHPSLNVNENYQRLEFLGDAILRMLIIDYLLRQYPKIIDKAFLSPVVDQLISAETQIKIAKRLQLSKYVLSSASITDRNLSDVLEALIAAMYISAETSSRGVSFGNSVIPIILNWFKPEIMKSLNKYLLSTEGTSGSENFPALTAGAVLKPKPTVSNGSQVHSYATVTKKQVTKTQSLFWIAPKVQPKIQPKVQEDFPPLSASAAKPKLTDNSSKLNPITSDPKSQKSAGNVSASTNLGAHSYAEAATKRQVTKKL